MHILIVSKYTQTATKIRQEFRKSGMISTTITPDKVSKIWLTQFHAIYIHPPVNPRSCRIAIRKIRQSNLEIPIITPYSIKTNHPNIQVVPNNLTLSGLKKVIRIEALKKATNDPRKLRYEDLTLDIHKRTAKRHNETIPLRNKEFGMLELLMKKYGEIVSRNEIIETLWDRNATILSNTIEVHMSSLRKKIDKNFSKKLIHTIPSAGYRFGE
ncbi:MAG: winged helix-turn-helix domain-containing protein [Patescibacteria group bacterium]|nr:winged helix-turn-helix domain-containing protein [Patescibacteria group bacterium]